jgi:hypothetical protein
VPARHWQAAEDVLAGRERALEGHAQHTAAVFAATSELNWFAGHTYETYAEPPDAALNVPAAHATHGPPSGPEYPALHVQSAASPEPSAEVESAAHPTQLPAPGPALNVLAAHTTHAPPSGPE